MAEDAILGIDDAGLSSFYANPLTLKFIATIVEVKGEVPRSRARLFELAVSQLRLESSERYQQSRLASFSENAALIAAGSIMAAMLVTGHDRTSLKSGDRGLSHYPSSQILLNKKT